MAQEQLRAPLRIDAAWRPILLMHSCGLVPLLLVLSTSSNVLAGLLLAVCHTVGFAWLAHRVQPHRPVGRAVWLAAQVTAGS